jgi:hypothetical protein
LQCTYTPPPPPPPVVTVRAIQSGNVFSTKIP